MKTTILVYADGRVETLPSGAITGGRAYVKHETVAVAGELRVVRRAFLGFLAHNRNTKVDGVVLEDAWGEPNDGAVVYVEKPCLP